MDTAQWLQEMVMKQVEEIIPTNTNDCSAKPCNSNPLKRIVMRPQKDQGLNCPRCNSTNTKFCYYNNYKLSQPRYLCKTCRRYWTEGGTLKNIPVGGGSRKNKKSSLSSLTSSKKIHNPQDNLSILSPPIISQNHNNKIQEGQDLNLGFPPEQGFKSFTELIQSPLIDTGITPSSRGFNSFIPTKPARVSDRNSVYCSVSSSSGFSMPLELKPSLDFSLYGLGTNNNNSGFSGSLQNVQQDYGNGSRFMFPFVDLNMKQATTTPTASTDHHHCQQNKEENGNTSKGNSSGYWNGLLGGGSW